MSPSSDVRNYDGNKMADPRALGVTTVYSSGVVLQRKSFRFFFFWRPDIKGQYNS